MDGQKLTRVIAAFKVSAETHEAIWRSARKGGRNFTDQVRYLIERGLEAEEGSDVGTRINTLETEVHAMREQLARYVSPPHRKRGAS